VTSFEYRLHPVQQAPSGIIAFPFEMAAAMLKRFRELAAEAPDTCTWLAGILPGPAGGKLAAVVVSHFGSEEEGQRALRPIRELGSIVLDTVARVPYCALQQQLDASFPKGLRSYWKSALLNGLRDEVIGMIIKAMRDTPSGRDQVVIEYYGGAVSRVSSDATAFEHRNSPFNLLILAMSTNPALDHAAYADARFRRLAAIKSRYDPGNLFRFNQNMAPRNPRPARVGRASPMDEHLHNEPGHKKN